MHLVIAVICTFTIVRRACLCVSRPPGASFLRLHSGFICREPCLPCPYACEQGEEAQLFADAVGWGNETALVNVSVVNGA